MSAILDDVKSTKKSRKELKTPKTLSKGAMAKVKNQVLQTIADTELLLSSLDKENADYEGGYSYIEENLRQLSEELGKLAIYDDRNCEIWGGLADLSLDTLDKAMKQYDSFVAQNKIPKSLMGIKEYMDLSQDDIKNMTQKNKCTIRHV